MIPIIATILFLISISILLRSSYLEFVETAVTNEQNRINAEKIKVLAIGYIRRVQ